MKILSRVAGNSALGGLIILTWLSAGCTAPRPEPALSLDEVRAKMSSCLPPRRYRENDGNIRLKVLSVIRRDDETIVRVVAEAKVEAGIFDLPAYSLSRGRWLIRGTGRAFLMDQDCRQYRLKGRRAAARIPPDGKIKLKLGESFEADLLFPRLSARPDQLMLVYNDLVLVLPPIVSDGERQVE